MSAKHDFEMRIQNGFTVENNAEYQDRSGRNTRYSTTDDTDSSAAALVTKLVNKLSLSQQRTVIGLRMVYIVSVVCSIVLSKGCKPLI